RVPPRAERRPAAGGAPVRGRDQAVRAGLVRRCPDGSDGRGTLPRPRRPGAGVGAVRGRGRRWLPWVVVAAGVALGAALSAPSTGGGRDLDPASTAPTGSRALVDALRALGTHVDVTTAVPGRGTDAVLVLVDGMGDR